MQCIKKKLSVDEQAGRRRRGLKEINIKFEMSFFFIQLYWQDARSSPPKKKYADQCDGVSKK